jgi:serine/threonine protein phosphatase PrpC
MEDTHVVEMWVLGVRALEWGFGEGAASMTLYLHTLAFHRNIGNKDNHLIMVCDGHGGQLAAKKVAEFMPKHIKETYDFDTSMFSKERRKTYAEAMFDSFLAVDRVSW